MGKWVTGQVKMIVEEMINAKLFYNDTVYNTGTWISRKSEYLAPFMSMQEICENKEKVENEVDKNKESRPKGKKIGGL